MSTIYVVEWRYRDGLHWREPTDWAVALGQIAPGGFLTSFSDAQQRIEMFGAHDNCAYRIVPYTRGEL